jgi:hypothetical protein
MLYGVSSRAFALTFHSISHREKGVGSTIDPGPNQGLESNKTEVLRLLLVLLSRQIYTSPSSLLSTPSIYTLHIIQKTPRRDVLTLLCSLLNTAMNSTQPQNIIGGVAGRLPYNHLVFKGEDPRATLVSTCLQVLCVLLDCQSGSARDVLSDVGDTQTSSPTTKTNAFRYFLAKLVGRVSRCHDICELIIFISAQAARLHLHIRWRDWDFGTADGVLQ